VVMHAKDQGEGLDFEDHAEPNRASNSGGSGTGLCVHYGHWVFDFRGPWQFDVAALDGSHCDH